ncbi:hypothetical protein [Streptomyces sp. KR55]|uniref:hypothetical protein n=1 Tax=Streptomyces sp. KR55 TaxID=3457425 RepID=UPI003FD21956
MPSPLVEPWLRGVAANPAAPSEVLLRLLDPAADAAWKILCEERELPADIVDALIAHPQREVRRGFARNRHVTPAQRGRLVNDPDALVRDALASGPRPRLGRVEALPEDVLETLLTAQDDIGHDQLFTADVIKQELAFSGQIPPSFHHRMPDHKNPELRAQAAGMWLWLTPGQRDALLADPDPAVRDAARVQSRILDPAAMEADLPEQDCHHRGLLLVNYAVSHAVVEACLAGGRDLWALAHNPHTPADAIARLARHPDPRVRERVASRADLDPSMLAELARDPDDAVRARAQVQPLQRTWAQRAVIDRIAGRTAADIGPLAEMLAEPDTSWYSACALSAHPLLRRVAATCPRLPEELVTRLADDPDLDVRHLLAYKHPLAPPRTVLDAFIATPRQRPYLLTLPGLPRTGLQHLLDHEDPDVRALAAADTTLAQPPIRLLTDPNARVRRVVAANPLLPPDLISTLLEDPETAEGAAANPNLPTERLHELLDLCGLTGAAAQ